ncbi:hypothetical protein ABBQ32_002053 [Trebouxia sp. C0010 RCD-2024]
MSAAGRACLVKVTPDALDLQYVTKFVQDDSAGAIATFSGVTRNSFHGKNVIQLEYEAYHVMAEKVLQLGAPLIPRQFYTQAGCSTGLTCM